MKGLKSHSSKSNKATVWHKCPLCVGITWGIVLFLVLTLAHTVWADKQQAVPLDDLRTFAEVYARIKKDYVVEVSDKELLENAIHGMLAGLDPHSSFLSEAQFHELQIGTSGEFGGLGIEVGMENGLIKVIAPIDDTPAKRAGVQTGDLIIKLDDKLVKGMSLEEAIKLMRGDKGSEITLTIVRKGEDAPLEIVIVRDVIRVRSVRSRILEPGFGYVRISNFQSKTTHGLRDAIESLEKENKGRLKGLVLDLRNNPGGIMSGAVGVSDVFLQDDTLIVYTEGRVESSDLKYHAHTDDFLHGAPLVILINQGSASASEIVAGAMQDHKRATILGTTSHGKGLVQTVLPMKDSTALKLTTACYYTPLGRSIQSEGIVPDILLQEIDDPEDEGKGIGADLIGFARTTKNQCSDKDVTETSEIRPKTTIMIPKAQKDDTADYELEEALKVLKSKSHTGKAAT